MMIRQARPCRFGMTRPSHHRRVMAARPVRYAHFQPEITVIDTVNFATVASV
ncbi:hypothetical protein [Sphingobium yanoikuyae]|uniref:hypothetical protein n=1 Tax=Sphingobium yanoikuyae TaxID=13690 RepID=UPI0028AF23B9|nr:hypothetical protein [Sphingobium yanoikuyae]